VSDLQRVLNVNINEMATAQLAAFTYCIPYTCARTLGSAYQLDPLMIGLVLLSFGIGAFYGDA
jgi:hypothetical protein